MSSRKSEDQVHAAAIEIPNTFSVDSQRFKAALKRTHLKQSVLIEKLAEHGIEVTESWFSKTLFKKPQSWNDPTMQLFAKWLPLDAIDWTSLNASTVDALTESFRAGELARRFGEVDLSGIDTSKAKSILKVVDALSRAEGRNDAAQTTDRIDDVFRVILGHVQDLEVFNRIAGRMRSVYESVFPEKTEISVYPPGITTPELYFLADSLNLRIESFSMGEGAPRSFAATVKASACLFLSESLSSEARRAEVATHIGYLVLDSLIPDGWLVNETPDQKSEMKTWLETVQGLVAKLELELEATSTTSGQRSAADSWLTAFLRDQLAKTFAGALLLPKENFLREADATRVDVRRLAANYRVSIETVVLRIVLLCGDPSVRETFRLPEFHCLKTDIGGNLLYRVGGDYGGVPGTQLFPRRIGTCSRWASVRALRRPAEPTYQVSVFEDGTSFFCVAFVITGSHPSGEFTWFSISLGCKNADADKLVYYKYASKTETKVGGACTVCKRDECSDRAIRNPTIDEPDLAKTSISRIRMDREWQPITDRVRHQVETFLYKLKQ